MILAARLRLRRIISAWTMLHTVLVVTRGFSIVSSAARLRLGLVIFAARLPLGRIISSRTLLDTAVQRYSFSGRRTLDAVISAIRLRLWRVILLLTLLYTAVQYDISAARLRLGHVIFRGIAHLQPGTDLSMYIKVLVLHQGGLEGRHAILGNTKLEPGQDLEASIITTFYPGGRCHEFRGIF